MSLLSKSPALAAALFAPALLGLAACGPAMKSQPKPADVQAGQAFLAANAKDPAVHTLSDGLEFKVLASGDPGGPHPRPQDEVKVNYEGRLLGPANAPLTGQVFDSSFARGVPADFPLAGLVPAWVEALQLMRPGDEWMLYVPSKLAYGDDPPPGGPIPPGAVLIFRIQLLGVLQHDGPQ
ncbi:MAG TPA: FKBP-type peptidyl-prolyl cis-trans isomerase [Caulobacteraceae bacterium]|nr:FKBP-type peptidyl-prolyl cis-trans isomerase [Caulobacteraceae bacterium]